MKSMMERKTKASAFTLTEVLIAVAIVGIIAGLVLPKAFSSYQKRTFDSAFEREIQTIQNSIDGLAVSENKADFFSTMMYVETKPDNYDDSVGLYMKKYLRTTSICDEPKNCFADEYYIYEKGKKRDEYKPDYKGACAILKNGMSLCLTPQIGADNIYGVIDLNGKKGPNVYMRDMRYFKIKPKTRVGLNQNTDEVEVLDWENLGGEDVVEEEEKPIDPCDTDPNGLTCCQTKEITSYYDPCCNYPELYTTNETCMDNEEIILSCTWTRLSSGTPGYTCTITNNSVIVQDAWAFVYNVNYYTIDDPRNKHCNFTDGDNRNYDSPCVVGVGDNKFIIGDVDVQTVYMYKMIDGKISKKQVTGSSNTFRRVWTVNGVQEN